MNNINKKIIIILTLVLSIFITAYFSVSLYYLLNDVEKIFEINLATILNELLNNKTVLKMFILSETIITSFLLLFSSKAKNIYHSKEVRLTNKLKVPKPVGEGQHGSSWWLNKKELDNVFKYNSINRNKKYNESIFDSGGIIVNYKRKGNKEKIYYLGSNSHMVIVGSTGSGKSRSIIIPTITMLGLAGENMFISDVKGELYLYTAPKLIELGYKVITLDYINLLKSDRYNYLDIIINAVEENDISKAESLINDLVSIIVENNDRTEPIWKNRRKIDYKNCNNGSST